MHLAQSLAYVNCSVNKAITFTLFLTPSLWNTTANFCYFLLWENGKRSRIVWPGFLKRNKLNNKIAVLTNLDIVHPWKFGRINTKMLQWFYLSLWDYGYFVLLPFTYCIFWNFFKEMCILFVIRIFKMLFLKVNRGSIAECLRETREKET